MPATAQGPIHALFVVGISLLFVVQVGAQSRTGLIAGQLVDVAGNFLAGATIDCEDASTGHRLVGQTSLSGMFEIALDPGTYTLRFYVVGLPPAETSVVVESGRTLTFRQVMNVPHFGERIDVAAATLTAERLPGALDPEHVAITAAGLNHGQLEGGWQANGASGAENGFLIDGVLTNSVINGSARATPSSEFVGQVQVATRTNTAEIRGTPGVLIDFVTRSGSNAFAAEGRYTFSGSRLSGSPVPRLVLSPADLTTVSYVSDAKAAKSTHQLDLSFGGPLKSGRLWFFAAASGSEANERRSYAFSSGATLGELKQRTRPRQALAKINVGSRRLAAAISMMAIAHRGRGVLPPYNDAGPNEISSSLRSNQINETRGSSSRQIISQATLTLFLARSSVIRLHASSVADGYQDLGVSRTTSYTYQTPSSDSRLQVPFYLQGPAGTQNVPRALQTLLDRTHRTAAGASLNRTFGGATPHKLSAGVEYQRAVNRVDTSYPGGYVSVFWGSAFVAPDGQTATGAYGYYEVNDLGLKGSAGSNSYSVYVQDDLRASARLSFQLGARLEQETIPSFRRDIQRRALSFGFLDKVAPRVGLAYELSPDGTRRLSASWGRFFDWTKYSTARELFGGRTWRTYYRSLDDPSVIAAANLANMPGADLWPGPGAFQDHYVPSFRIIDPGVKATYQDRLNVGLELALTAKSSAALHFVHTTLQRPIEDVTAFVGGQATYVVGNPGFGLASTVAPSGSNAPFEAPSPMRQYTAFEALWHRPFSGQWFAEGSYTLSRLYGNYAGVLNSDQVRTPTTGAGYSTAQASSREILREAGNLGSGWDTAEALWDSHGHFDPKGRLATDRTHVVKLFGSYTAPFGTTVGFFQYLGSGTPISTYLETANQAELFVNGRGDMGRTPFLTQTDLLVRHDLELTNRKTLRVELNVLNLFNQKTARHIFNSYNRGAGTPRPSSAPSLAAIDLRNGFDYKALVAATPDAKLPIGAMDPRYGMPDLFNPPLEASLTVKFHL